LGKTTLAHICREMGVNLRRPADRCWSVRRSGSAADKSRTNDVLFIDESPPFPGVEEILYPALEDFQLDIMIAKAAARSVSWICRLHSGWRHDSCAC